MTDPWNQPQQPPPGYAMPAHGYTYDGPPGRIRPTGASILLFVVTFGIYGYVYNYQVHDEMKGHSGRGLGGGIALLLTFLANIAMPFLTPHEVGNLYERKGRQAPVKAITGLWLLVPTIVGYVLVVAGFIGLVASSSPQDPATGQSVDPSGAAIAFAVVGVVLFFISTVAGGIVWFVKTNNALNRYWETLARGGFTAPST
ncbi:MAG: hypothetical protein JWL79_845 [Frankiales bacterium]|nr:hypothetical protein [Frankiales bacterium]